MPPPTTEWLAEQYHSGRFNLLNAHHHILSDREHETLSNGFNSLATEASGDSRLERTLLVTHIQSQLPLGFPHIFADLVYRVLAYHSTAPFYKSPTTALPESLSLQDTQRALAWLLPGRHLSMATIGNHGRMRTRADHRRLLFQSLANRSVPTADNPANETARRRYAHRNAFDMEHVKRGYGVLEEYASINRDDDGDEMYHDLLDVLQNNVPDNYPYGSKRDDLRPLAKELRADFAFHELAVARGELSDLARALLALQFETNQTTLKPGDLEYLDEAVASVMATFVCDESDVQAAYPTAGDLIAWPAFDQGLKQIPHIFDPVYRVLNDVLLNGEIDGETIPSAYGIPPELHSQDQPHILSLGFMTLTAAILPPLIDWDALHTVLRWRRDSAELPSSHALWTHIRTSVPSPDADPPASILAFTGRIRGSGARFTGGVLSAADYDANDGRDRMYSVYVFRLEPEVQCKKLVGQEWRVGPSGELVFDGTSLAEWRMDVEGLTVGMEGEVVVEIEGMEVWKDG
ncbi:hypothetical protein P171DRAFT_430407 [Karstenula rhodostoma CBS 690.94]|uniref:TLDc domain-containing protein n=1 Tax=Karstenula rhodostoma CBS 690.94 TaxID=1392251 RepID=A0A9P4PL54_9PLEO|nr:hypothetical protein P171DRAFT_430407 [Karstenula rhodostoma CBS 690.94]